MKWKSINQKNILKTTFLICLLFSLFFFALINTSSSLVQLNVNPNLDSINEILITSDSDPDLLSLTGNGTIENPFLIENIIFTGQPSTENVIYIYKTTKHIEIRNCTFYEGIYGIKIKDILNETINIVNNTFNGNSYSMINGIRVENSYRVKLEWNIFSRCEAGIYNYYSQFCYLTNNTFSKCLYPVMISHSDDCHIYNNQFFLCDNGILTSHSDRTLIYNNHFSFLNNMYYNLDDNSIDIEYSEGCKVVSNIIFSAGDVGIRAINCDTLLISKNGISKTEVGILIESVESIFYETANYPIIQFNNISQSNNIGLSLKEIIGAFIYSNKIEESRYKGISAEGIVSTLISRNSILQNGLNGIFLYKCSENMIEKNSISYNDGNGLHLMNSNNISINYNYFHHNRDYGVYIDYESYWNQIDHNEFYSNNQMGESQAYDDGEENLWYNPTTLEGNFWSDFESGDYEIDGASNSADTYPLSDKIDEEYTVIANILFVPSIMILFLFLLVLRLPRRSKKRS